MNRIDVLEGGNGGSSFPQGVNREAFAKMIWATIASTENPPDDDRKCKDCGFCPCRCN